MKKLLAVLLAALMVLGMFGALAEEEPIHLTLWTFQELHTQLYKEMLEKWNANPDNPKLDIDMQVYPYEDMHNKLTIALQSGEGAPDIVDIEINMFANYLKGDIQLAELNDIVEPIEDHLVMSRFNNYAKDGKFYGIDHHIGACIVWYNTEILEEAGIDYHDIKTWDDYHEAGKIVLEHLNAGRPARTAPLDDDQLAAVRDWFLLTMKKVIYAANIGESDLGKDEDSIPLVRPVKEIAAAEGAEVLVICAQVEEDISQMEPDEKQMFLDDMGIGESGLDRLVVLGYRLLGLISYLTAGPKEVRAWTIENGTKAPQAAGKIHTDFERGFIRAEIVPYDDLVREGSMAACKEKGLIRSEGKDYVMKDGDVTLFRFNV